MLRYVFQRLVALIPVTLTVTFVIFALLNWAGGDPVLLLAGDDASPETIAAVRAAYGLDHPFFVRFGIWLSHILQGDLGTSIINSRPVLELIGQRAEPTISLAVTTLIVTVLIGVPIGIAAAWWSGSWLDAAVTGIAVVGFSVPIFVVGYMAILLFALELQWLPVQGFTSIQGGLWPFLQTIILPTAALSLAYLGWFARVTRDSALDVLKQDYIRTAIAKGASGRRLVGMHILKNSAIPVVTVVGMSFAFLLGGVVVTENVFAIPGLGRLTVDAILQRDYPVIQGVVLLLSGIYILVNLLVDLSYVLFDPRIRY